MKKFLTALAFVFNCVMSVSLMQGIDMVDKAIHSKLAKIIWKLVSGVAYVITITLVMNAQFNFVDEHF